MLEAWTPSPSRSLAGWCRLLVRLDPNDFFDYKSGARNKGPRLLHPPRGNYNILWCGALPPPGPSSSDLVSMSCPSLCIPSLRPSSFDERLLSSSGLSEPSPFLPSIHGEFPSVSRALPSLFTPPLWSCDVTPPPPPCSSCLMLPFDAG